MNPFRPQKTEETFKDVEAAQLSAEIEAWVAAGNKIQKLAWGERSQPLLAVRPRKKKNGRNHAPLDIRTKAKKQESVLEGLDEEE